MVHSNTIFRPRPVTALSGLRRRSYHASASCNMPMAVLSPAKTLDESPVEIEMTTPTSKLQKQRDELLKVVTKLSKDDLKK